MRVALAPRRDVGTARRPFRARTNIRELCPIRSGGAAVLRVPESEIVTIVFRCKAKRIEIVSTVLPRRPRRAGGQNHVEVTALRLRLDGKFGYTSSEEDSISSVRGGRAEGCTVLKAGHRSRSVSRANRNRRAAEGVARPLAQLRRPASAADDGSGWRPRQSCRNGGNWMAGNRKPTLTHLIAVAMPLVC